MRLFKHALWKQFTNIARPFFASEARTKAIGGLVILAVLLLAVNGLNFLNSYVMRDFMTALEKQQPSRFYLFGLALAAVFGLASIGEAFQFFTEQRTGLVWRQWLTRSLVDRYLAHRAYHRLSVNQSIDNPDQRISEDIKTFTTSSLSFFVLLLNSVLTLSLFIGVLWSITPWLVLTAVLYSLAGSLGTILLGRQLIPLNNRQLQKEADFRFALGRIREHGESGGARDGQGGAKQRLLDRFKAVVENFLAIYRVTRNVGFFTREYNYLIQIIPAVVVAPLYFYYNKDFGIVAQSAMAFGQVVGAFSLIVTKYQEMSTFAAVVHRLGSMWEATESAPTPAGNVKKPQPADRELSEEEREKQQREEQPAPRIERHEDDQRIAYEKLTLWTPQDRRVLIRDLSLEVPEGKRLLVSGSDDSGKTALCLATAGLWGEGEGKIVCPKVGDIIFLPQRLYTATGCLRDLLLYGLNGDEVGDDQLRGALRDVGLDVLAEQAGGLDSEWDWSNDLSTGDRHALALARLLLARPRFALLDGLPWGLTPARLKRLYEALARSPITYISLGGPSDLQFYHDQWLELCGDGRWRLRPTHDADGEIAGGEETERSREVHESEGEQVMAGGEKQQKNAESVG